MTLELSDEDLARLIGHGHPFPISVDRDKIIDRIKLMRRVFDASLFACRASVVLMTLDYEDQRRVNALVSELNNARNAKLEAETGKPTKVDLTQQFRL